MSVNSRCRKAMYKQADGQYTIDVAKITEEYNAEEAKLWAVQREEEYIIEKKYRELRTHLATDFTKAIKPFADKKKAARQKAAEQYPPSKD